MRISRLRVHPLIALTLGGTFLVSGLGMLVCAGVGFIDGSAGLEFAVSGVGGATIGAALIGLSLKRSNSSAIVTPVIGLAAVAFAWTLGSAFGAVPMLLAGSFESFLDGYFEAVSGFTTTGATLLSDIEAQPDAVLLWRSLMQWLGGIGIIVLVVAIAPVSGPGVQRAFYAETSGVSSDRLTPRIIDTAKIIAAIYLVLSIAAGLAYGIAGMGVFDAVNHSMTTIATGGFSTNNLSIGAFDSVAIEIVSIVFMLVGGINFAFYWKAIRRRNMQPQSVEVFAFVTIVALAAIVVGVSIWINEDVTGLGSIIVDSLFSVTTIITTTGFTTADFDGWNDFARVVILIIMFIGACAGSTAGGIKVVRVLLLGKAAIQELERQLSPNRVQVLRLGSHVYPERVRTAVLGFFLIYVLVFVAGVLAMSTSGLDMISSISAASSTLNMIGPGLGEIGALESFEAMSDFGRATSCFLMIAGRLEVFTVVALLVAVFDWARDRRLPA